MEKSTNFDDLCRLCGEIGSQIIPVFGDEGRNQGLKEKIENSIRVTVSEHDELPKGICSSCNETLCNICNFVHQCQETQEKLQDFLAIQQSLWLVESQSQDPEVSTEDNFEIDDPKSISHDIDISTFESNDQTLPGNANITIPDTFTCIVTKSGEGQSEKDITQCMDMPNLLQEQRADGNALLRFPTVEPGSPFACALEDTTVLSVDAAAVANGRGNIRFQKSAAGMKIVFPPTTSADAVNFTDLMQLFSLPEVKSMFTASHKVPTPVPSPLSSTCSWSWDISQLLDMEEELEKGRCGRAMTPLEVAIPDEQPISGINSALSLFEDWNLGISPVLDLDPNVATVGVVTEKPPETKEVSIEFIIPREKHKKFKRPPPDPTDEHITEISPIVFKCNICEEKFRYRYKCQRHVRNHTGEKPYICGLCGKSFTVKYYLDRHVRSHDQSNRLRCKFCGKSFTRLHHLKEHEDGHKGPATLECAKCSRRFHSKAGYEQHVCSRAQPRLVCDICGGTFAGSLALRHHRVRHEAARFRCPQCPAMYHARYELDRHLRRHKHVTSATSTSRSDSGSKKVPILPNPTSTNVLGLPNPTSTDVLSLPNPTSTNVLALPNPTGTNVLSLPNPTNTNVLSLPNPTITNVLDLPNPTITNVLDLPNPTGTNVLTLPNPTSTNVLNLPNPTGTNVLALPNPTGTNFFSLPNPTGTNVLTLPNQTGTSVLTLPNTTSAHVPILSNPL